MTCDKPIVDLSRYDLQQVGMMEGEMCIRVTEQDEVIEPISKKQSHLWSVIKSGGALHRAFSVFLFNEQNELLLQQRSSDKITFPSYWTNTCCSHPLWLEGERDGLDGVMNAAIRKLEQELGIVGLEKSDLIFITRILYQSPSDGLWGEHEVDYVFFVRKQLQRINANPNEAMSVQYVNMDSLKQLFIDAEHGRVSLTPWFKLICEKFLFEKWWNALCQNQLESQIDTETIHNLIN